MLTRPPGLPGPWRRFRMVSGLVAAARDLSSSTGRRRIVAAPAHGKMTAQTHPACPPAGAVPVYRNLLAAIALVCAAPAWAGNWPAWRGPRNDGASDESAFPLK